METLKTGDGSITVVHPTLHSTYHSKHGAVTESQVVFIENGLLHYLSSATNPEQLSILEIGFGTGLNLLLTIPHILDQSSNLRFVYDGVEKYPLSPEKISLLGYKDLLPEYSDRAWLYKVFTSLHQKGSLICTRHNTTLNLEVHHEDIEEKIYPLEAYNIVYFDAFGPGVQPELWDLNIAQKMYNTLKPGGFLATYCVQGLWRRHLRSVGFKVEKLSGPPGKREVLRAYKT